MCNETFSKILAFLGALVLGVIAAVLYYVDVITNLNTPVYLSLGLSGVLLAFGLALLFTGGHDWRCLCRYASALLYGTVLSIAAAAAVLAVSTTLLRVIFTGVWATLAAFALIVFFMLIACRMSAHCGCGASGEGRCQNGACRFG